MRDPDDDGQPAIGTFLSRRFFAGLSYLVLSMSLAECPTVTLDAVLNKHNTDKNASHHNYGKYYEKHIAPYRTTAKRYLEIGVRYGESLRAMREYLCNADRIVGIDIDPATKRHEDPGLGIYVELGDQRDPSFLAWVNAEHGPFDVILDDGSHIWEDVKTSFETLFPMLRDGGLYIVEDTHAFYNNLGYFNHLTRHVNYWRHHDMCADPWKHVRKTTDPMEYGIKEIAFANNAVIIQKEVKTHWIDTPTLPPQP